jgi:hypothetical protein
MPFDGTTDAKAVTRAVLLGVLDTTTATARQGVQHDGRGRRCLVGALRHVRRTHGIQPNCVSQNTRTRCGIQRSGTDRLKSAVHRRNLLHSRRTPASPWPS